VKGFTRDERGAVLLWVLVFIPVLISVMVCLTRMTQAVTVSDLDLLRALESGVKAAASRVTPDSQAAGDPRINTLDAHMAFRRMLAGNLGLDVDTLQPLPGSLFMAAPDYILVVYNGDGSYAPGGALAGRLYAFLGGSLAEQDFAATGFPFKFGVGTGVIQPGGSGPTAVTLETPGVVAVAGLKFTMVLDREPVEAYRWAAARIVR